MKLAEYNRKRDFKQTSEPAGKKGGNRLNFVIQRHHASRLHYDFRLQMDGVLKSWAVPKGPSLNPKDKRLAVLVEDHPVSYKSFEGMIPDGNYGAGRVDIWDEGKYEPVDEDGKKITGKAFSEAFEQGSMKFRLSGKILKGEFALVRMDENNWLLIKHKDEYAVTKKYDSEKDAPAGALAYTAERSKKKARQVK
jgi:bifunctional non-homologous end joining protein LigD